MLGCYLIGGMAHGVKNTLFRTLLHQNIDPARHGQAFAAYNGLRNGAELIALAAGGGLTALVGGAGTLWIAGGGAGLTGLAGVLLLRPSPAAEDQAAEGEAEPERADGEAADRDALPPCGKPLPAAERLLLLLGQRLAAALLAQRAAGPEAEVEVVEDLRRLLVGHLGHCIACFAGANTPPPRLGPPFRGRRRPSARARAGRAGRALRAGARDCERRPHPPRPPRAARAGGRASCAARPAGARRARQPRHPVRLPGALHLPWRGVRAAVADRRAAYAGAGAHVVGLNSVRRGATSRAGSSDAQLQRAAARLAQAAPGALRVVVLHHQLINAPWRSHKKPVARRDHVLARARRGRRGADRSAVTSTRAPWPSGTSSRCSQTTRAAA